MSVKYLGVVALAMLAALPQNAQAGDAATGEKTFKMKCFVCHDAAAGKNKTGPSLFGVVGRTAGTAEGFKLYRGLKGADWTWDDAALDAYLTDPIAYTKSKTGKSPGMVLKVPKAQERADIIAYLKTLK